MKIAVLYGGKSAEHEVSIQSAKTVCSFLEEAGYKPVPVYISRKGKWFFARAWDGGSGGEVIPVLSGGYNFISASGAKKKTALKVDAVFPLVHGPLGEDGTLQGLLEQMGAAYAGCGVAASAIGMDKEICKRLASACGIPVLAHFTLEKNRPDVSAAKKWAAKKLPVFVKPAGLGSSVGVAKVSSLSELPSALKNAFLFDTRVMVEQGVDRAREIVCGLLGSDGGVKTSVCGEVRPVNHEFYDYDAKYLDERGFELVIPAKISPALSAKIKDCSEKIFKAIGGTGFARADFLLERGGKKFYFCEINTIPGFTSHSLYPRLWQAAGLSGPEVVDILVKDALSRKKSKSGLRLTPSAGRAF